ncbi:uncharacterized protein BT62DRAFT_481047 [Guyanagaster necrorhizus]|uniref:F-box domain-containing protein n=1 Tax=Guyanagaster necrorhizus TaxID=856835 RepID=A0A9P7VI65_9AGAR|nr:uncharacterized protein BT62DRAFT_481047 [Guyanagaster necrorhizus MCA 3950]KAG7441508.1 hypothetical protein BT62DRAFT_481047 [Guyanagaster necrorhizus MCA 3950]
MWRNDASSRQRSVSIPCIPPEIIEEIIDYLWNDTRTLISCSSVCRVFYPRTRMHLFRTIDIRNRINIATRFVEMTKASPNLLSCVRDTRIRGTTVHLILAPVLPLMANLTSLKIQFIKLAKICDLHAHVFQLLALKEFSLDAFYYDQEGPPFSPLLPTRRGPALERMVIEVDGNLHLLPSFFHAGLRSVYVDTLQYLEVDKPSEKDLHVLSKLTRIAGSLKHLRLLEIQWDVRHWPNPPALALTGLESLSMEIWYKDDLARIDLCILRWLIGSLSSMDKASSLQSLELKLKCWEDSELREVDEMWLLWMRLDDVLSRPDLSRLCELRVKISGEETTKEGLLHAQALTDSRFPLALERGILVVCTDDED